MHEAWAKGILKRVSYYRFIAYALSLKTYDVFHVGVTSFKQIYRLYEFYLKFRLLLWKLLKL
ncbi:Abi family protein [Paenibacillus sp. GSMTC-2017]|nr:Abi family protein [Paenibacillus sp. GSMTC-2017]